MKVNMSTKKIVLYSIGGVFSLVAVVALAVFLSVFRAQEEIVADDVEPAETEPVVEESAAERATRMHVAGEANPSPEQVARMEAMNAANEDMNDEERRALLEKMQ